MSVGPRDQHPSSSVDASAGACPSTGSDDGPDGGPGTSPLRDERLRAGLSQQDLAGSSGVSVRTIRHIESGSGMRPRARSLQRLASALGMSGDARSAFLGAWGVTDRRHRVDADEMLMRPDDFPGLLTSIRPWVRRYHAVHNRSLSHVGARRTIEHEEIERVVAARDHGLDGVPLIIDTSSVTAPEHVEVEALEGVEIREQRHFATEAVKVVHLAFGRRLASDDLLSYRVRVSYRLDHDGDADVVPESGRQALVGLRDRALLCLVVVEFRPDDRPRTCRSVFQEQMGGALRETGVVVPDAHGRAQTVRADPGPGWYGLTWTW